jgi:hypothetical protein
VIEALAGRWIGEVKLVQFLREELIRGIGFDEEPVRRDHLEGEAFAGSVWTQEGAGEGEVSSQGHEAGHHFRRAAIGVEENAPGRARMGLENVEHLSPRSKAMEAQGAIISHRQVEVDP